MPDAPVLLAGRYRLGASLGRGGMGQVFLARDETLERDVAIKEIDQPFGADGGASARRTLREARASARINHPNVVQVYDVLQLEDRTWIVMEYVPSRSLREEIAEQGRLDPYRVARIGLELLGALRTAHRLGVEHRDVKPANVLLADDGRVLLTDFGIAAVDDDGVISRSDILVGSPQFMAPERAQGRPSGPEADLWSLGATLYAAIEGRSPYQRGSTMATLTALATEEPDPPVHAGVLRPLLDGLLRKDPATRMTAEDAENLARGVIDGLSTSSDNSAGQPTKPSGLAGFAASFPAVFRIPRPRSSNNGSAGGSGTAGRDRGVAPAGGSGAAPAADSSGSDGGSAPTVGSGSAGSVRRRPGRRAAAPKAAPDVAPQPGSRTEAERAPGAKAKPQPAASSAAALPSAPAAEPDAGQGAVSGTRGSADTEPNPETAMNPAGSALEPGAAQEVAAGSGVGSESEAGQEVAAGSGVGSESGAAQQVAAGSGTGSSQKAGSGSSVEPGSAAVLGAAVDPESEVAGKTVPQPDAEPEPGAIVDTAADPDAQAAGGTVSRLGAEPAREADPGEELEPGAAGSKAAKRGKDAEPKSAAVEPGMDREPDAADGTASRSGAEPKREADSGAEPDPQAAGETASQSGAEPKRDSGPGAEPKRDAGPGAEPKRDAGPGAEPKRDAGPGAEPKQGADPGAEQKPEAAGKTASRPGVVSKPTAVLGTATGPGRRTKSDSTLPAPVELGPESEPDTRVDQAPPAGGWGVAAVRRRLAVPDDDPDGVTGTGRNRRGLIVAVAALAVVLVVGVAWAVTGRTGGPEAQPTASAAAPPGGSTAGGTTEQTSPTPSAAASSAPAPAPAPPSPTPTGDGRPQLPAGWVEYKDKTGFSLYVPAGWKRSKEGTIVYFRGDGKILGIDQTDEPKSNPVKDWRTQADNRVSAGDFPQYDELGIRSVDYFRKAADWEFTFMRDGVRRHVNNRGTVVADDKAYGIYWQTPDSEWNESRDDLQLVFDSFVPARSG